MDFGAISEVDLVYVSAAICACMFVVLMMIGKQSTQKFRDDLHLLPSPPGRIILGHLHLLQQPLHQCLQKLAQKYGPLFCIKMGSISTLVVSSPHWARVFLHAHGREFANRPQSEYGKRLLYRGKSMLVMNYCPTWRHLRKLCVTNLLTVKRIEMFEKARQDEMVMVIKFICSQASVEAATVDIRKLAFSTVGNMLTRMLFSKRSFDTTEASDGRGSRFKELVEEFTVLFATPVFGDFIPWLSCLDISIKRRMDTVAKEMDAFFEGVLAERIESKGEVKDKEALDYLDLLLDLYIEDDGKIDKESIKSILQDLFGAGTETTMSAIEWAMAELLQNPRCLKKLQEELDSLVAGEDAMTGEGLKDADLAKLSYLHAVIKETFRLHPPATLIIRELCDRLEEGIQVESFRLPPKIRVLVNVWALGRDPMLWGPEVDTFCPERFLRNSMPDVRGQHFELLPFGMGRRGCPGMNIALTMVHSIVANLVKFVDWSIPDGIPLDTSEAFAFTTSMAKHLVARPSLRVLV